MPPSPDSSVDCHDGDPTAQARPFIGILFECCGHYVRVYRRPSERQYVARCPGCLRVVRVAVGPEGTSARIFRAR
ncbi:MAG: hypothetical protein LC135_11215 [Phycisphaerae bacterium]|jgi:hypothetical protein|nr:hypothetical protein [Phycisphaerae bacterium]MCZ2400417.1 hypothetical protein [Phycisphaerae bacterium]